MGDGCVAYGLRFRCGSCPNRRNPCDAEYFKSLESRAWLEAQREITQNQNLIYKPDSVLAYTCFDQFANVTANMQTWNGFSETNRWSIGDRSRAVDTALNNLVAPSLVSYLTSNFNNNFLGGRGPAPNYTPSNISGGAYNCTHMNMVWQAAKCYNFQTLPQDGFFTFEEHAQEDGDTRKLPTACVNPTVWDSQIIMAGLKVPGSTTSANAIPKWPFDKVEVYYDKLDPQKCTDSTPLPTGVTVKSKATDSGGGALNPTEYPEHICIIPGCYYDPSGSCKPSGG
ncbi:MAG: hypothetical protein LRZ85_07135 [Alphaproteobacteria bacterium]|nr:hypothetical protein [Alphaproteobacteria bacterium]